MGTEVMLAATAVTTAVSAYGQYKAGKSQEAYYKAQANQIQLQGRIEAAKAKQQGTKALDEANEAMALTVARSAAGGLNPFASDSSPLFIQFKSLSGGVQDWITARDTAFNITTMSQTQAENYRQAGRDAARGGTMSALMTIGQGALTMNKIKPFSTWTMPGKPSPSTFMISDIKVKENIIFKEKSKTGINIYEWNYVWDKQKYKGVLAQEIVKSHPQAVIKDKYGYLNVCYDLLDVEMSVVNGR